MDDRGSHRGARQAILHRLCDLFNGGDHVRDSFVFVDQVFYVVEAASSPTYGPRSFSHMTISSIKGPSFVLSWLTNSTVVIQYSIRNNGPNPSVP